MINQVKKLFATPSAEALALREYAESMCKYREAQIKRLTSYIRSNT